jgi:hypothetical protein
MVAVVSSCDIIKSYSSLGVTLGDLAGISITAVGISALLARHPATAPMSPSRCSAASTAAASKRLPDPETGGLLLIAIGTFLDVLIAALGTYAVGHLTGMQEDKEARHFV